MIHISTTLSVSDNSGAKKIKSIKVFRFRKNPCAEGVLIRGSIKAIRSSKRSTIRVKKGEVCVALIIRTKISRFYTKVVPHSVSFSNNAAVLLNKQYKLIGTRITNPFSVFFRQTKFLRLTFLTSGLIK